MDSRPNPALAPWLFLVVLLNVVLATGRGFADDIGFWLDWIGQLQAHGFAHLKANYPPVYMHWLWLLAQGYTALEIIPGANDLLRLLANTPVMLAHLALTAFVAHLLCKARPGPAQWQAAMAFTVFNPVLLLDGPLWGQVDLLFCLVLILALHLLIRARYLVLVFPLLAIALLTKFQTICAAPVLLALLWHQRRSRRLWLGLLPASVAAAVLLAPYLLAGSTLSMIDQTYLKASSLYPYASLNATNLWYLMGLNERPDTLFLLSGETGVQGLLNLFTPKWLGLGLCALCCLGLLIDSLRHRDSERLWRNAILSATGFFVLLPGMHERYLVPAVVIALVAAARHSRLWPYAIVLTLLSALNIAIILRPHDGGLPYAVAAATVLFGLWAVLRERPRLRELESRMLHAPARAWALAAALVWLLPVLGLIQLFRPDTEGWLAAQRLPVIETRQDWGKLRIDRSVGGGALELAGQRFTNGFGTHANARIVLPVPVHADAFEVFAGLNRSKGARGMARFSIVVDGVTQWESGDQQADSPPAQARVTLAGARRLELVVDALGANFSDHADWANPRFHIAAH